MDGFDLMISEKRKSNIENRQSGLSPDYQIHLYSQNKNEC